MKVNIIDYDHNGRGIAKNDGKVIFIPNTVLGETVDIEIIEDKKNYSIGKVIDIITPSKDRREVICPYYLECGGCDLMHLDYDKQCDYKINKVKNILNKYADLDINPTIVKSDKEYNYRNKIVLHKQGKEYGLYRKNSNDIIHIDECQIVDNDINKVLNVKSDVSEVTLRKCDNEIIGNILEKSRGIKTINDIKFNLSVDSFFQVNDYICSKLFDEVSNHIDKDDIVLDLYAGVGTLSIVSAKKCKYVYSVEINKSASIDAEENVKLNNINNVEVINGDASKFVNGFDKPVTKIIVDPPRSGLDKNTINFINDSLVDTIIYIACDPLSLARDIRLLDNYKVSSVKLFDMFPNTYHVETFCVLERND